MTFDFHQVARRLNPEESVFDWNNQASLALQKGSFDEAAFIYTRILARLRTTASPAARGSSNSESQSGTASGSSSIGRFVAHRTRSRVNKRNADATASTPEQDDEEERGRFLTLLSVPANSLLLPPSAFDGLTEAAWNHFAIYDQAFVTAFRHPDQAHDANNRRLIAAFTYYNLGLCLHYKEFATATYHLRSLSASQKAYIKALKILTTYRDTSHGTEDLLLLKLALYNNLGHLYVHLSDFSQAIQCHQQIQQLLTAPRRPNPLPMNPQDWAFFVHSFTLVSQDANFALSPAA